MAIEPYGWMATLHEVVTKLSPGCEALAVTRHDYAAEHSFEYAINGTVVTGYRLRHPYVRHSTTAWHHANSLAYAELQINGELVVWERGRTISRGCSAVSLPAVATGRRPARRTVSRDWLG